MAVGLSGSGTVLPGCSVVALIGVMVLLEKLPTNTCPAETATVWGPGPTAMAGPARRVDTSIGVTRLLPKSATNAVAPAGPTDTATATGWWPTAIGLPARQVPRSIGVTLSETRLATSAMPRPPVPPGATATASGSTPTPTECTTSWVAGSISDRVSFPCVTTSSPRWPAV